MRAKEDQLFGEFFIRVGNGTEPTIHDDLIFVLEEIKILLPNGLSPYRCVLKVNCLITILRNLDRSNGLYNGTRAVCNVSIIM
ncbi:hypothetical protein CXB51_009243 [Gossypium anomalum]|uniref:DNA helicase Pif1-like 2B domain-containing protein n=1 Tax=Gossypium anomalum TaxID=47600 RepID=A0A8J6D762_9ROSI|nr:hypothetical protein CXB51_009243 [Gossypium anomalum]